MYFTNIKFYSMKNEFDCKKQQTQSVLTRCCAGLLIGFCVWGTSSYPLPVYASDAVVSIEEQQQQAVRITGKVTDENGEPLFCAKDVCDVLGYKKSRNAVNQLVNPLDALKQGVKV